jgi:transcriptional regulator with XRE-family HTH domain
MLHKISKHDRPRRRVEAQENAVLDVQFAILDLLQQQGLAKEELAYRLGVTKSRVSQLFAAGANPTLKQIAKIFDALDQKLEIKSVPLCWEEFEQSIAPWDDLPEWNEPALSVRSRLAGNDNYYREERAAA